MQVDSLPAELPEKPKQQYAAPKSLQSCPTLCNPLDVSPLGSSVHGIFQARVLEWGATLSPEELPNPGILHWQADSLPTEPQGLYR